MKKYFTEFYSKPKKKNFPCMCEDDKECECGTYETSTGYEELNVDDNYHIELEAGKTLDEKGLKEIIRHDNMMNGNCEDTITYKANK